MSRPNIHAPLARGGHQQHQPLAQTISFAATEKEFANKGFVSAFLFFFFFLSSEAHDASENVLSILEFLDAVLEEGSLTSCGGGLGHKALQLGVWHFQHNHGRENVLEISDDVALNDLGDYVGDESLLLYLFESESAYAKGPQESFLKIKIQRSKTSSSAPYLVNGQQAVQSFFAADLFHVNRGRGAPVAKCGLDLMEFHSGVIICIGKISEYLLLHPTSTLGSDRVRVVVVVVDGEIPPVPEQLAKLLVSRCPSCLQFALNNDRPMVEGWLAV